MNSPSIIIPFLVFFLTISLVTSTDDLIDQTCKEYSKVGHQYKFCFDTLTSDPESHGANLSKLGLISFNIAKKNATDTLSVVKSLLKDKKVEGGIRAALVDCSESYSDAIDALNDAATALNEKRYMDVNMHLSAVITEADTCGEGFQEFGISYPLMEKRNDITINLTAIGLAIWEMLK